MRMPRPLKAADFGAEASAFTALDGTFRVAGNVAIVTVRYVEGAVGISPWAALGALKETARAAGATSVRIEATIADATVMGALRRLLGPASQGRAGGPQDVWELIL